MRDLPEHREEVRDACLRQGMFPTMMENLPASDAEAIAASLKLVNEADIYVGVFAHRYGYVPKENNPRQISVTEMEYERAVERGIPRLIFLMDESHPITIDQVEYGEGADKLKAFKERLQTENIVNFFKSPEDLRAHVINSLSYHRRSDLTRFHYVSDIPEPPEAFIAHPYTLLQTHRLVGRRPELNLLTDWVAKPGSEVYKTHILNVVAVGGMGKSALTWQWFDDIAPQEMKPLAGRMWWSFYESDATFENFVTRALAYVTRRPLEKVRQIPAPDRETQLLHALDREPFLLVLDGLERILIAYARMDAAHLNDDDYDKRTANFVANAYGLPASAAQSFTGEHRLRKTADPRAGSFLRKLAKVRASRILISTRLYPDDLQTTTSDSRPGCYAMFLQGLSENDALDLWHGFGVGGSRDMLLPLFERVGHHPLLIQALASVVARYRPAPGDFDAWRRDNADFDPFSLPLVQVKSHVLAYALRGLDDKARDTLHIIVALRMPARYDALAALLLGRGKRCANAHELDEVLTELEDRGLVGWNRRGNRYDVHPLVRGVILNGLDENTRLDVYTRLHAHFHTLPMVDNYLNVNDLDDLIPPIELYNIHIGLKRYDKAAKLYFERLSKVAYYRLTFNSDAVGILELLFPNGSEGEKLPHVKEVKTQADTLKALGAAYKFKGNQQQALSLFRRSIRLCEQHEIWDSLITGMEELTHSLCVDGKLHAAVVTGCESYLRARLHNEALLGARSLRALGVTLSSTGRLSAAGRIFHLAGKTFYELKEDHWLGANLNQIALRALWAGDPATCVSVTKEARRLINSARCERCLMVTERLEGLAMLELGDLDAADKCLQSVWQMASKVILREQEFHALVGLAKLRVHQGEYENARGYLDALWDTVEAAPYPTIHSDACNVLAQIERDTGHHAEAVDAATRAYRLAWCDGPPFAYHWGLTAARRHLEELGAPEPEMPPFDASRFEPIPDIGIDLNDESHGNDADL